MRSGGRRDVNDNGDRTCAHLHGGAITTEMHGAWRASVLGIGQMDVRGELEEPGRQRNDGCTNHPLPQATMQQ